MTGFWAGEDARQVEAGNPTHGSGRPRIEPESLRELQAEIDRLRAELDDRDTRIEYLEDHLGAVAGMLTLGNKNIGGTAEASLVSDVVRCASQGIEFCDWAELNAADTGDVQ